MTPGSPHADLHLSLHPNPLGSFGVIAEALQSTNHPLRLFAGFLAFSGVLDIVWFVRNSHRQGWFTLLLSIVALVLKVPTFAAVIGSLRARGDNFYSSIPSVEISSRGVHLSSSEPIWSAPGDFEAPEGVPGGYNVPPANVASASAHKPASGGQQGGEGGRPGAGAYSSI